MQPENLTDIIYIATNLANSAIPVLVALSLLYFIWGLASWILNTADTEKHKAGRDRMIWGVVTLFVIVSIWGIVNILTATFFDNLSSQRGISGTSNSGSTVVDISNSSSGSGSFLPRGGFFNNLMDGVPDWLGGITQ